MRRALLCGALGALAVPISIGLGWKLGHVLHHDYMRRA